VILDDLTANKRPRRLARSAGATPEVIDWLSHYAEIAKLYVAYEYDWSRMRDELVRQGRPGPSESTLRRWVFKARETGLLSEAPAPGHAGGQLTDRARRILDPARPVGQVGQPEREIVEGPGGLLYARRGKAGDG
jgi:hypothetical protein